MGSSDRVYSLEALLRRANFDPGHFTKRRRETKGGETEYEDLDYWRARAAIKAIRSDLSAMHVDRVASEYDKGTRLADPITGAGYADFVDDETIRHHMANAIEGGNVHQAAFCAAVLAQRTHEKRAQEYQEDMARRAAAYGEITVPPEVKP